MRLAMVIPASVDPVVMWCGSHDHSNIGAELADPAVDKDWYRVILII